MKALMGQLYFEACLKLHNIDPYQLNFLKGIDRSILFLTLTASTAFSIDNGVFWYTTQLGKNIIVRSKLEWTKLFHNIVVFLSSS